MSFGLFAAGLAKGAIDTYSTLDDIERKRKADERSERALKIQEEEYQTRKTEKSALKSAISEQPTGDTVQVPTYEGMTGGFDQQDAPMRTEAISPEQRRANFRQRAVALGADPLQVQQYEAGDLQMDVGRQNLKKGGLEIKKLEREATFDEKFDNVMGNLHKESAARLQDIQTTAQTGGMKGLVDKFGPELKKALGADVQLVGNNIVVKAKGQKPQTISSLDQAVQALEGAAQMEFGKNLETRMINEGLFKSPQDMVKYFQDKREADRKERDTDSAITLRGAQANQANAAAGYYNRGGASANRQTQAEIVNEKIDAYATVLRRADPNLSEADAKKRAAQVIMRDPEAQPSQVEKELSRLYAEEAATAKTPEALLDVRKKYAGLGLNTGYVDPLKAASDKLPPGADPFAEKKAAPPKAAVPGTPTPTALPTNQLPTNPYRRVTRGGTTVDQAAMQADLAEYNELANSALPLAAGRRKMLEAKLRAAGVLE